ncbi:hypothetical protein QUC32_22965 [Novosphingobium resinovorum]|uniref:hypothetical protein n=1 Tax=Novosphingobium TaxID=165696 RepID=UPI001B3C4F6E|nr:MULTISPECIES: hypothetical protein [Novosphingobium]MBF7012512.1 hypothetical protein [Novosphingobium sp. HR1a]WJM27247.1 hypothetical protein QUC32_22965 [Novosphingobium resinovorum]
MSIARQMRRRRGLTGTKQFSKLQPDGSILTLHPTKGWRRTSAARVALRIDQAKQQVAFQAAVQAVLEGSFGSVDTPLIEVAVTA